MSFHSQVDKMPCKCSGIQSNKCDCKIVSPALIKVNNIYHNKKPFGSQTKNTNDLRHTKPRRNQASYFLQIFERFYEKCAGYNLRYFTIKFYDLIVNDIYFTISDLLV